MRPRHLKADHVSQSGMRTRDWPDKKGESMKKKKKMCECKGKQIWRACALVITLRRLMRTDHQSGVFRLKGSHR